MTNKKRRHKSNSAALYIPVGVIVVVVIGILGICVFLRVVDIDVTGDSKYSKDEILQASGISPGENLMFLDTDAAALRIRQAMPYIAEASIEPVFPNQARITVKDSVPIAVVDYQGTGFLIDSSGRVLDKAGDNREGLVEIRGFIPSEAVIGKQLKAALDSETQLGSMTEILSAFEKEGMLGSVSYLDVTRIATISFRYEDRFTVILGGSNDVLDKLAQLPEIVDKINTERSPDITGVIKMNDPSGAPRFTADW